MEVALSLFKYRLEEAPSQTRLIPEGEIFDPKRWPRGTVIRYSYDVQTPNQPPLSTIFVGVVVQRTVGFSRTDRAPKNETLSWIRKRIRIIKPFQLG